MKSYRLSGGLVVLALFSACAASAWALYKQIMDFDEGLNREISVVTDVVQPAQLPPASDFRLPPIESFSAAVERPLFRPDRRPAPESASPPAAPEEPLKADIVGIVISGERNSIILQLPKMKDALTLHKGDVVLGWKLVDIGPKRALFERNGQLRALRQKFYELDSEHRTEAGASAR